MEAAINYSYFFFSPNGTLKGRRRDNIGGACLFTREKGQGGTMTVLRGRWWRNPKMLTARLISRSAVAAVLVGKMNLSTNTICKEKQVVGVGVPRERVDCVVIGAGVVGVAIAKHLSLSTTTTEVLVIDSAPTFGTGTSSRNSQVIHAGIYYPPNSLKALFCVRGRELLYKYCKEHDIPHKQIGLRLLEGYEAMRIEPELKCKKALLSPVSGIVDTHSLILSLVGYNSNVGLGGSLRVMEQLSPTTLL
ncbi:L-2-hydroxyglutarate dehydrogenase, mitochondrial [Actinidia eriantha]|uniref:L-2-hydroxyglutarate dehydrogenase, mitochondrial n=1 Tax=Actinidia eriantha TaxID=165200 RepID=UPI00258FC79A|nr:L-2-hydroxyglutarate dehydrogenase, mitochondrial [Actinidia eriantha]